jgi:hypothetical protein
MKHRLLVIPILLISLILAQGAFAGSLVIKAGDTIQKILESHKGKRITLRLAGGGELSGKVRSVTKELVQLGELSGQEFFDGVVEVGKVSAVIVRVKE